MWSRLCEFPAEETPALTFVANIVPSGVPEFLTTVMQHDPSASLVARAGSGVIFVRCSQPASDAVSLHAKTLLPAARKQHGNCLVYAAPPDLKLTPLAAYGAPHASTNVYQSIKQTFDPQGILSPGVWNYD